MIYLYIFLCILYYTFYIYILYIYIERGIYIGIYYFTESPFYTNEKFFIFTQTFFITFSKTHEDVKSLLKELSFFYSLSFEIMQILPGQAHIKVN